MANLAVIKKLAKQAIAENGVEALVLPENAFCHPYDSRYQSELDGVLDELKIFAQENRIWIFAGTLPALSNNNTGKVYSAFNVINDLGQLVATYKKIHLFDVYVQEEGISYQESSRFDAGNEVVVVKTPWGNIGLAVCYDLRFPELFQAMELHQPFAVLVPSAFTLHTGQKHWKSLLSARALDNFVWVLAPNQVGVHPGGRSTFGHTSIVNPNGDVEKQLTEGVGYICHSIDADPGNELRKHIPLSQHRRIKQEAGRENLSVTLYPVL